MGIDHLSALPEVVGVLAAKEVVCLVSRVDSNSLNGGFAVSCTCDNIAAASADNEIVCGVCGNRVVAAKVLKDLELVFRAGDHVVAQARDNATISIINRGG